MAKTLFLKPAADLSVNDPAFMSSPRALRHLPAEGRRVEQSMYWVKCIRRGEVIVCDETTGEPLGDPVLPTPDTADGIDDSGAVAES